MKIKIKRLDSELPMPARAYPGDAGLDLRSRIDVTLQPGERRRIPCGIAVEIPPGHVGLVLPRSGLASSVGLSFVNACGVIDEGFRGEVEVIAINLDRDVPLAIAKGDRIAQLLVVPVVLAEPTEVSELSPSTRSTAGFGSSGTS